MQNTPTGTNTIINSNSPNNFVHRTSSRYEKRPVGATESQVSFDFYCYTLFLFISLVVFLLAILIKYKMHYANIIIPINVIDIARRFLFQIHSMCYVLLVVLHIQPIVRSFFFFFCFLPIKPCHCHNKVCVIPCHFFFFFKAVIHKYTVFFHTVFVWLADWLTKLNWWEFILCVVKAKRDL